ncbi:MAG: FKBP-type peptidyl-prolyl cis-trans isomerase [Bacteroidales bacterium]|nr:FKBP-type peptidyl-prolyl cis-trans isomerase [Bacteroidales bacterium]
MVSKDKFVSLVYILRENDVNGKTIEEVKEDQPLSFIFGNGQMLPMFEENISNLKINDSFEFGLKSDDAYGPLFDDAVVNLPKDIFMNDGKIDETVVFVNNVVPMQDKDGNMFYGRVCEIVEDSVKMDFNHPMAGKNLHFTGKIIEVRDATHEELSSLHKHDSSCGCGC